jgi:hypothetical protein
MFTPLTQKFFSFKINIIVFTVQWFGWLDNYVSLLPFPTTGTPTPPLFLWITCFKYTPFMPPLMLWYAYTTLYSFRIAELADYMFYVQFFSDHREMYSFYTVCNQTTTDRLFASKLQKSNTFGGTTIFSYAPGQVQWYASAEMHCLYTYYYIVIHEHCTSMQLENSKKIICPPRAPIRCIHYIYTYILYIYIRRL